MSGNHTPTPWRVCQASNFGNGYIYTTIQPENPEPETMRHLLMASGEYHVCHMMHTPLHRKAALHLADAEFIVTAVNSYASSQAEIERLAAENATLRAAATKIDADWAEAFPEGPEGNRTYLGGFGTLSDDTVEVWRVIRAALSGSKK